jgi:hypothetical protein
VTVSLRSEFESELRAAEARAAARTAANIANAENQGLGRQTQEELGASNESVGIHNSDPDASAELEGDRPQEVSRASTPSMD